MEQVQGQPGPPHEEGVFLKEPSPACPPPAPRRRGILRGGPRHARSERAASDTTALTRPMRQGGSPGQACTQKEEGDCKEPLRVVPCRNADTLRATLESECGRRRRSRHKAA